jgi:hypothetical protein
MLNSVDDLITNLYYIAPLQVYPEVILNKEQVYTRHDPKGNEMKITLYGHGEWVDGVVFTSPSYTCQYVLSDSDEPKPIKIDKIDVAIESLTNHIQFTMDLDQMECDDHNVLRYTTMSHYCFTHDSVLSSNCFFSNNMMGRVSALITTIAKMIATNNYDYSWWDTPLQSINIQNNTNNTKFSNILKIFISNEDQSHIQKFMQTGQIIEIWEQTLRYLIEHNHAEYMRFISDQSRDHLITQFTTTGKHLEFVPYLIETAPRVDPLEKFKL